jgi:hypothetical protein
MKSKSEIAAIRKKAKASKREARQKRSLSALRAQAVKKRRLSAREQILIAFGKEEGLINGSVPVPSHQFLEIIIQHDRRTDAQIARAYARAVEWAYQGKDWKSQLKRLYIIARPRASDAALAKRWGVKRQKINLMRNKLCDFLAAPEG